MHSEFVFTLNRTFNTKSVCKTYELWGFYCVVIVVSKDVFAAKKKCFSPWFLELQATTIVTVVFVVKHNRNWKMYRGECLFIGRTLLQLFVFFLTVWKHFFKKKRNHTQTVKRLMFLHLYANIKPAKGQSQWNGISTEYIGSWTSLQNAIFEMFKSF